MLSGLLYYFLAPLSAPRSARQQCSGRGFCGSGVSECGYQVLGVGLCWAILACKSVEAFNIGRVHSVRHSLAWLRITRHFTGF